MIQETKEDWKNLLYVTRMEQAEDREVWNETLLGTAEVTRIGPSRNRAKYFHEWAQCGNKLSLGGWQYQHLQFALSTWYFLRLRLETCVSSLLPCKKQKKHLPKILSAIAWDRGDPRKEPWQPRHMIQNRSPNTFKRYLSTWGTARPPLPPLMGLAPLLSRAKAFHLGNIPCGGTTRHDINRNRGVHWKSPSGVYWWIWSNLKEPLWIRFCVLLSSIITST